MTMPIGNYQATPPMTMNQILGVPQSITQQANVSTASNGQAPTTGNMMSYGSSDYTRLSSSTMAAIGLNPNMGQQAYPPQPQQGSSIFNNPPAPAGYPTNPMNPMLPSTGGTPYTPSAATGSINPQQQAILTQIQNDPSLSPQQKQSFIQQLTQGTPTLGATAQALPPVMPSPVFNNQQPVVPQIINTSSQPSLQQIYAKNLQAQILQITGDKTLSPEIKAVRIKDLQAQFQNLQVVANTGSNIQEQINQINNNPSIPPEAKQQLIGQLTGQAQKANVEALAPQQPDIFKVLLGGVAKQFLPGLLQPGEALKDNPLLNTAATVASIFTGVDLVTGVKRPEEESKTETVTSTDEDDDNASKEKTIEKPKATATYEIA